MIFWWRKLSKTNYYHNSYIYLFNLNKTWDQHHSKFLHKFKACLKTTRMSLSRSSTAGHEAVDLRPTTLRNFSKLSTPMPRLRSLLQDTPPTWSFRSMVMSSTTERPSRMKRSGKKLLLSSWKRWQELSQMKNELKCGIDSGQKWRSNEGCRGNDCPCMLD